jgi:hypothetical protein
MRSERIFGGLLGVSGPNGAFGRRPAHMVGKPSGVGPHLDEAACQRKSQLAKAAKNSRCDQLLRKFD